MRRSGVCVAANGPGRTPAVQGGWDAGVGWGEGFRAAERPRTAKAGSMSQRPRLGHRRHAGTTRRGFLEACRPKHSSPSRSVNKNGTAPSAYRLGGSRHCVTPGLKLVVVGRWVGGLDSWRGKAGDKLQLQELQLFPVPCSLFYCVPVWTTEHTPSDQPAGLDELDQPDLTSRERRRRGPRTTGRGEGGEWVKLKLRVSVVPSRPQPPKGSPPRKVGVSVCQSSGSHARWEQVSPRQACAALERLREGRMEGTGSRSDASRGMEDGREWQS